MMCSGSCMRIIGFLLLRCTEYTMRYAANASTHWLHAGSRVLTSLTGDFLFLNPSPWFHWILIHHQRYDLDRVDTGEQCWSKKSLESRLVDLETLVALESWGLNGPVRSRGRSSPELVMELTGVRARETDVTGYGGMPHGRTAE